MQSLIYKELLEDLVPVVLKVNNTIHQINYYPVDKCQNNKLRYPLDSNEPKAWCCPPFEQHYWYWLLF